MSCKVILIRHGETVWNYLGKLQGHRDVPLSEVGLNQAKALAKRLEAYQIDAVYSSDLQRAYQTANAFAEPKGLLVQTVKELREMDFGKWEGMSYKQIQKTTPELWNAWVNDPISTSPPQGEPVPQMAERVYEAIKKIVSESQGKQIAIVCHGGSIRAFISKILGMKLSDNWRIRQDNVSLNILDFPDWENGIVMLLNDRTHIS